MNEWTQFFEIRHPTLQVRVAWNVNQPSAEVYHLLTGDFIGAIPVLTGWGRAPTIREFTEYIAKQPWTDILEAYERRKDRGGVGA